MSLFESISSDGSPSAYGEPMYRYLCRAADSDTAAIRERLEIWFSEFPGADADLQARFRSDDNEEHLAATWELYCCALLHSQGYTVQPHPELPNGTCPDFLVLRGEERLFYFECTIAGGSRDDVALEKRRAVATELIDGVESPNFLLDLRFLWGPQESPPTGHLRHEIGAWLGDLDPDEVAERLLEEGYESLPSRRWEDETWGLEFVAIPKKERARGDSSCTVGITTFGPQGIEPARAIQKRVSKKAKHYGELDLPLVLSVNALDKFTRIEHAVEALLGPDLRDGQDEFEFGKPNGAWHGRSRPRNQTVSAVLFGVRIGSGSLARDVCLFHNPWSSRALMPDDWQGHQWQVDGSRLVRREARSAADLLALRG